MPLNALAGRQVLRYVNRLGQNYYARQSSSAGTVRYVAARTPLGALTRLPAGYEICEDINGRVSIRRIRPRQVAVAEERLVVSVLFQTRPHGYKAAVRDNAITIFASALDRKTYSGSLDAEFAEGFAAALEETLARKYGRELADLFRVRRQARDGSGGHLRYYPLLQFELADRRRRLFKVKRIYFTGDQDWLLLETLSLSAALMKYLPHLGKDSFFDLL